MLSTAATTTATKTVHDLEDSSPLLEQVASAMAVASKRYDVFANDRDQYTFWRGGKNDDDEIATWEPFRRDVEHVLVATQCYCNVLRQLLSGKRRRRIDAFVASETHRLHELVCDLRNVLDFATRQHGATWGQRRTRRAC